MVINHLVIYLEAIDNQFTGILCMQNFHFLCGLIDLF